MTMLEFDNKLEAFANAFIHGGDSATYAEATVNLINSFYADRMKKSKEELVTDMLNYITAVRGRK